MTRRTTLDSTAEHAKRDAKTTEAAGEVRPNGRAELSDPAPAGRIRLRRRPPRHRPIANGAASQAASSIAGALRAPGGALQPIWPDSPADRSRAQQAMQTGMGLLQQTGAPLRIPGPRRLPLDETGWSPDDFGGFYRRRWGRPGRTRRRRRSGCRHRRQRSGWRPHGGGTTDIVARPAPGSPASTAPSSAPLAQITPPAAPSTAARLMPAWQACRWFRWCDGRCEHRRQERQTDIRRVSVPRSATAPVQGRLTTPPALSPVTKKVDGAPVVTRRVANAQQRRRGHLRPLTHRRPEADRESAGG